MVALMALVLLTLELLTIKNEIKHNRGLIQQTNRRVAKTYDVLKPKPSPCDMEGFEILTEDLDAETR
jgi:hypothetical protein